MRIAFLFTALVFTTIQVYAEPRKGSEEGVQLIDVGVIGLTSHDLISWDREKKELRDPKGRLDLGTVFDWIDTKSGKNLWETGGDPKNSENAVVFSVVQRLLGIYRSEKDFQLSIGKDQEAAQTKARIETLKHYLKMVKVSYERLFGLTFPFKAIHGGVVTHEEHAAMRAAHHILPGKMLVSFGPQKRSIALTDFMYSQLNLTPSDLAQPVRKFNGRYDDEYLHFTIPFGPRKGENQNLYEIDRDYVETFTKFKFDDMIKEVAEKGSFAGVSFQHEIESLYAKGLSDQDNIWLELLNKENN